MNDAYNIHVYMYMYILYVIMPYQLKKKKTGCKKLKIKKNKFNCTCTWHLATTLNLSLLYYSLFKITLTSGRVSLIIPSIISLSLPRHTHSLGGGVTGIGSSSSSASPPLSPSTSSGG